MSNRLTIKGQVTIPKNVRDFLGLTMGSSAVEFSIDPDGSVRITKALSAARHPVKTEVHATSVRNYDRCDRVLALLSGSFI